MNYSKMDYSILKNGLNNPSPKSFSFLSLYQGLNLKGLIPQPETDIDVFDYFWSLPLTEEQRIYSLWVLIERHWAYINHFPIMESWGDLWEGRNLPQISELEKSFLKFNREGAVTFKETKKLKDFFVQSSFLILIECDQRGIPIRELTPDQRIQKYWIRLIANYAKIIAELDKNSKKDAFCNFFGIIRQLGLLPEWWYLLQLRFCWKH